MKVYHFLGYSSYTGYADIKTNFKDPLDVEMRSMNFDLILAMKIYNFLGYSSYTGYTDLKTNSKNPLEPAL